MKPKGAGFERRAPLTVIIKVDFSEGISSLIQGFPLLPGDELITVWVIITWFSGSMLALLSWFPKNRQPDSSGSLLILMRGRASVGAY